ncbi:SHOCT domain-containing protein [Natrinema sp. SYSU A 869]|uniref:SHOCT domain-containing protein n=1 Tax=Natrinema sp. SYSU A 869 TaxID=2871694 RepID=UPI001CA3AEC1|nr:SHOCT domain-containing protein [Natrinema sp. SYSU A 869]
MDAIEGSGRERSGETPWNRLRENASGIASLLVTAIWLGAMFTGQDWWLAALLVGYIAVVPVVAILFDEERDADDREWDDSRTDETVRKSEPTTTEPATDTRDALETLRERYAAGELTDEQFERKLEQLLDTETLEDAQAWARERNQADQTDSRERDRDREPEFER